MSLKELKLDLKKQASKTPENFYPIQVLKDNGFNRAKCSKCDTFFWSTVSRKTCGEPECSGGYSFINDSPTKSKIGYLETWNKFSSTMKSLGYTPIKRYPTVARWRDDTWFTQASIYAFQPFVVGGVVSPPANPLVMSQPSLRFNDIDNVGITGRHYSTHFHLGQHAFQSPEKYDKEKYLSDIITWLTKGVKLPLNEIQFHEDQWGGGGNLGVSLEYFSRGVELGNQVYMTYKVTPTGYKDLDINVLDMGSGQERYPWLTSGKPINFELTMPQTVKYLYKQSGRKPDMDLWTKFVPVSGNLNVDEVDDIEKMWTSTARKIGYSKNKLKEEIYPISSLYAIADHSRTLLFALADGALPSNSGGGYNLRSIYRRSMDFANKYNVKLDYSKLIELHAKELKPQYPELSKSVNSVQEILKAEERKYNQSKIVSKRIISKVIKTTVDETKLLELYDSQGITPEELSEASKGKIKVPSDFYMKVAERHEKRSGPKLEEEKDLTFEGIPQTTKLFWLDERAREFDAKVLKIIDNRYVILDKTLFYATSGGQNFDSGSLNMNRVVNTFNQGPYIMHEVENIDFKEGDEVIGRIDDERRTNTMKHHTATHVIGGAARKVLGKHIWQAGSDVNEERGRLDITHFDSLTGKQLKKIEKVANKAVQDKIIVEKEILSKDLAEKRFGFTLYQGGFVPGGEVRVVHVKGFDAQACGGTHLDNTKEIGQIKLLGSKRIQDGVIRISYVSGEIAKQLEEEEKRLGSEILSAFGARSGNVTLEEIYAAAKILKAQKEHLPKTIARFIKEMREMSKKLNKPVPKIKVQPIPEAVEELFSTWKSLRKELRKFKRK
ncbi:MAG: alanine--tRNA ligase [Candidatus Nanoarchaeia archaeon]|jgi:alanyl-tRNA synthetase|nr:alanine--tRNA ligase [Candidatus Nanoarchaeia archaeon]|tara:strand:+ start:12673 stop:15180 length:2508 start_codon:yes stop_codon:yes gene_type:complete